MLGLARENGQLSGMVWGPRPPERPIGAAVPRVIGQRSVLGMGV